MSEQLFAYARVSTRDQVLDRQVDALLAQGVPAENIHTEKISGSVATAQRPELARLLERLRSGDTLWVDELSRLGRSMSDVVLRVHTLTDQGIRVRTIRERIDTGDRLHGPLLVAIFGYIAELHRTTMLAQQAAAREARLARGGPLGRPHAIPSATQRAAIVAAYRAGASPRDLTREFKIGRTTLFRYVQAAELAAATG